MALNQEVQCLYINGPAGGAGITAQVQKVLSVENILIPRENVSHQVIIVNIL